MTRSGSAMFGPASRGTPSPVRERDEVASIAQPALCARLRAVAALVMGAANS